jgi:AcrR family transcriptional regulator
MTSTDLKPENVDPDSVRIKREIIKAAGILFEEKGLYQTSVGEVADLAGVTVTEAYRYVRRKSEIILMIMEDFTDCVKGRIVPEIEKLDDPVTKILKAQEIFFTIVDEYAVQTLLLYRESKALDHDGLSKIMSAEMEHVKIFEDILKHGIQSGAFKSHDTNLMASNIIILGHEWVLKGWRLKERFKLEEYIAAQSKFILDAIAP